MTKVGAAVSTSVQDLDKQLRAIYEMLEKQKWK